MIEKRDVLYSIKAKWIAQRKSDSIDVSLVVQVLEQWTFRSCSSICVSEFLSRIKVLKEDLLESLI